MDDAIEDLEKRYNDYYKKAVDNLDFTSRQGINLICDSFVKDLKAFKENGRDRADTDLLFGRLIDKANLICATINKAIEEKNNSENPR